MFLIRLVMFFLLCIFLAGGCSAVEIKNQSSLTIVGEEYAPFSYYSDGVATGLSVNLIEKLSTDTGIPVNRSSISLLPWSEAYNATVNGSNTLLLEIYRLPDRENDLQWVGPIAVDSSALFVRSDLKAAITNLSDMKGFNVGVVRGDAHFDMLRGYGIAPEDIVTAPNATTLVTEVQDGTIDGFFYGEQAGKYAISEVTGTNETLPVALRVDEQKVWFGLSKDTPSEIVSLLQKSLDKKKNNFAENTTI